MFFFALASECHNTNIKVTLSVWASSFSGETFPAKSLWLMVVVCPSALGPTSPTAPWFPEPHLQKGRRCSVFDGQKLARNGLEMPKIIVLEWKEGKDVRKEIESYHPWQLAKRMPIRKALWLWFSVWCSTSWEAGKHMKGNYSCFSICTHVLHWC